MKLDNVAVRIADKKHDAAIGQGDRALGYRDFQFIYPSFDGLYIRHIESHVRITRMSFRDVHEDVVGHPGIGIENE